MQRRVFFHTLCLSVCFAIAALGIPSTQAAENGEPIRLGLIGLDTSHVIAYSQMLNDPQNPNHVPGARIVAGYKGGSPDIPSSRDRIEGFTQQLQEKWGIEIVETIPELCKKVDGILLTSVDGRPHLEQAKAVIEAGLPLYIDKPVAGSLADAVEIARLAKKANVPWFGGSSLRWHTAVREAVDPERVGDIVGCDAYSPCEYEPHHPDLLWYGVHGVEILFTAMGPGCQTVSRTHTPDADLVVGVWEDGRIGTFRGMRNGRYGIGCTVFGTKSNAHVEGSSYKGLVEEIVKFFQTKKAPLDPMETLELMAFMEAADTSKEQNGKPVPLPNFQIED